MNSGTLIGNKKIRRESFQYILFQIFFIDMKIRNYIRFDSLFKEADGSLTHVRFENLNTHETSKKYTLYSAQSSELLPKWFYYLTIIAKLKEKFILQMKAKKLRISYGIQFLVHNLHLHYHLKMAYFISHNLYISLFLTLLTGFITQVISV